MRMTFWHRSSYLRVLLEELAPAWLTRIASLPQKRQPKKAPRSPETSDERAKEPLFECARLIEHFLDALHAHLAHSAELLGEK